MAVSIFPLCYLGNSVLRRTATDELESIYELLFTYYLEFLRKAFNPKNCSFSTFTDFMTEAFTTVVMAVGQGKLCLRFISTEKCGEQTFRKHLEKTFNPDELVYFNCYYFEVVTPVGYRGDKKCYAYFRRVIDTRKCVPEDALLELDYQLSTCLVRTRQTPRPPLLYCIMSSKTPSATIICHVFLADNVSLGLRILRCLSELRHSRFDTGSSICLEMGRCRSHEHLASNAHRIRAKSTEARLGKNEHNVCPWCLAHSGLGNPNPSTSARAETMMTSCLDKEHHCSSCETRYCPHCGTLLDSDSSISLPEENWQKKIQKRLGKEALDFYLKRRRKSGDEMKTVSADCSEVKRLMEVEKGLETLTTSPTSSRNTQRFPEKSHEASIRRSTPIDRNCSRRADQKCKYLRLSRQRPARSADARQKYPSSGISFLP